ncbi:MAG: hypothetical protein EOS21_30620 [Mesorhizobium sp.]|nr:MAG: hypothetical protein EOS21_30620 [Mesorhizobium sp.]
MWPLLRARYMMPETVSQMSDYPVISLPAARCFLPGPMPESAATRPSGYTTSGTRSSRCSDSCADAPLRVRYSVSATESAACQLWKGQRKGSRI